MGAQKDKIESKCISELYSLNAKGGIFKGLVGKPSYEPGENLLFRIMRMDFREMSVDADERYVDRRDFTHNRSALRIKGALYVTNRRARLVGNFGKVMHEWRWDDYAEVRIIGGRQGVMFIKKDEYASFADCALKVPNNLVGEVARGFTFFRFYKQKDTAQEDFIKVKTTYILASQRKLA